MRNQEEVFAAYYALMPDEEVVRAAANQESLAPAALTALANELRKRGKENLVLPEQRSPVQVAGAYLGRWWWPMASDRDSARRIATYGATAAFFLAGLTGILALISLFKPLSKPWDYVGPEAIVDAFIFAFLGLMIQWKVSRIAAVGAALLYVFEQVYVGIHGRMGFVPALWAVIFLWAFASAGRGTFAFHAHRRNLSTGSSELKSL